MSLRYSWQRIARWSVLGCAGMCWLPGCASLAGHGSTADGLSQMSPNPIRAASYSEVSESVPTSEVPPVHADSPESGSSSAGPPAMPNLPALNVPSQMAAEPVPPARGHTAENIEKSSLRTQLAPQRWWHKKEDLPAAETPTPAMPSAAQTYIQDYTARGQLPGTVVVRYNPRTGITHVHLPASNGGASLPSPYQKTFLPLKPDQPCVRGFSAPCVSGPRYSELPQDDSVIMLPATIYAPSEPTNHEATLQASPVLTQAAAVEKPATIKQSDVREIVAPYSEPTAITPSKVTASRGTRFANDDDDRVHLVE